MQQALRPYVTTGIALVGASMIAVTPVAAPPIGAQVRPVRLVDAWSDFFAESATNWQNIFSAADSSAISQVSSLLLSNPGEVLTAFSNLTPDITTHLTSLPGQITIDLPPGLALGIAELGAWGAGLTALGEVAPQYASNPFEATATVLNGFFNGQDNISLLNGTITIPFWNGLIAPLQPVDVNLSLTNLVDALGLGDLKLTDLDLTSLLSQLGLGNLTLGGLFNDLGLSSDGLGTLLGNPNLGTLLGDLGLGNLGLGSFSLTGLLGDLGLDTNVNLNSLTLDSVLSAFGLNPTADVGLGTFLGAVGLGPFLSTGLGTELSNLGLLTGLVTDLNTALGGALGTVAGLLDPILSGLGLSTTTLLNATSLETALNSETIGSLLGGQSINDSLQSILTALGVGGVTPSGLTVGGLLGALGFSSATGDLSLSQLLGDLNLDGLNVGSLLNTVSLGDLLNDLGISNLPLDLTNLGDISNLTLGGLLGDLGLGDLASVTVDPVGGFFTELVDVVPQQILAALGM
ncbi:MAG: hypothetical protein WB785_01645 [Mycobacterium sp.]|uniref:hypothetical protein n=1 Tax=Mycobacterium sp. TaxID=1785 RepID=UPI003C3FB05C